MLRYAVLLAAAGVLLASTKVPCLAQDFKPYAGAKLDVQASRQATAAAPGKQSEVYITADSYDKVYAFYKTLYPEDLMHRSRRPDGQPSKMTFFLLDGAKDLPSSRYWMKIQHPLVRGSGAKNVRDVTVIQIVHDK